MTCHISKQNCFKHIDSQSLKVWPTPVQKVSICKPDGVDLTSKVVQWLKRTSTKLQNSVPSPTIPFPGSYHQAIKKCLLLYHVLTLG